MTDILRKVGWVFILFYTLILKYSYYVPGIIQNPLILHELHHLFLPQPSDVHTVFISLFADEKTGLVILCKVTGFG